MTPAQKNTITGLQSTAVGLSVVAIAAIVSDMSAKKYITIGLIAALATTAVLYTKD